MPTTVSNNMIAFNGGSFVFRNKIINGDMLIAQRGTTFSTTVSSQYTVDRWNVTTEVPARPGRGDVTQSNDVPDNNEFQNSLRFTTTIPSNANTQFLEFKHYIEGYDARDLINQPIIISFWVKTNKPGIYCLALGNEGNGVTSDRSYVTEYRINTTNWEKKTIHIPSIDISSGTWNWTNGRGLKIAFTLAGANNAAPTLNAWINGEFETSNNQENLLDNAGNFFNITGVQLERGPTPTPFEHRPFQTELALCQRYFEYGAQYIDNNTSPSIVDGFFRVFYNYKITKRTALPTITRIGGTAVASAIFAPRRTEHWCVVSLNIPTGSLEYDTQFSIDAEL